MHAHIILKILRNAKLPDRERERERDCSKLKKFQWLLSGNRQMH